MSKSIRIIFATAIMFLLVVFLISSPVAVVASEGGGNVDSISALWDKIVEMFSFGLVGDIDANPGCIPWIIARVVVNWAAILSGIVLLGYLIMGGIKYSTSTGDPGKVEEAQRTIINALIGFAITILAWTVAGLVMWLFGVSNECIGASLGSYCSDNAECASGECDPGTRRCL